MYFSLTATTRRLIGAANRISINTNYLVRMWKVGMKERNSIKGGEKEREGDGNIQELSL